MIITQSQKETGVTNHWNHSEFWILIWFSSLSTYVKNECKLDAINNSADHNEIDAFTNNALSSHMEHTWTFARCLKITEKVSFNIASEASYVYILSGQDLIKNAKNGPF